MYRIKADAQWRVFTLLPPGMAPPLPPHPMKSPRCRPLRAWVWFLPCMVPCSRPRAVVVLVVPRVGA